MVCVTQLISQQPKLSLESTADTKATRAEAALTEILGEPQQDMDEALTTTFIASIDTFHSNLTSPDELNTDEDLQQKLMVDSIFKTKKMKHLIYFAVGMLVDSSYCYTV